MKCSDIPTKLISDTRLRLLAPVLDKAADMHRLIVYFSQPIPTFWRGPTAATAWKMPAPICKRLWITSKPFKVAQRCGFEYETVLSNTQIDNAGVVDDACVYLFTGASSR